MSFKIDTNAKDEPQTKTVSLDVSLVDRIDSLAKANGLTRRALVEQMLSYCVKQVPTDRAEATSPRQTATVG